MHARNRTAGLTVVELIIAAGLIVVVIGLSAVFLARQTGLQRNTQARNEVQDNVRVAMQVVAQDLALVGNRLLVAADGTTQGLSFGCFNDATGSTSCLSLAPGTSADTESVLHVRYLSSQFPAADACRDVQYRVAGGALQRSDLECPGDATVATAVWQDIVPNVLAFKMYVICSDGNRYDDFPPTACTSAGYGRSAIFSVAASSGISATSAAAGEAVQIVSDDPTDPADVACPADRICYAMTQETLMPNLKDQ